LSSQGTGDREGASSATELPIHFLIFIFQTVTQNCNPVPSECVQLAGNFRIARQHDTITAAALLSGQVSPEGAY
jgi:hypothetical protein